MRRPADASVRPEADLVRVAARILKPALLVALLAAFAGGPLVLPTVASPAPARAAGLTSLDTGVLQQLNEIRALHRLALLKVSPALDASAAQHSREMAADGYFEHNSADGTAFWKRILHWYGSAGFGYWSVGENLLWSSPSVDPAQSMRLWMSSPEHRANILNPRWREIGISSVHVDSAPGTYRGLPVTIITTDFGVRYS
jgi:uncharacterized protein YkwD